MDLCFPDEFITEFATQNEQSLRKIEEEELLRRGKRVGALD